MFYIDIEDAAGVKLGTGPIRSASQWKVKRNLDGGGSWSFMAPLADVKLANATPRRYAHIYAYVSGSYQWVGGGPIDSIVSRIDADGSVQATVAGSDMLRELAWRSVGSLQLSDGSGNPISHAAAVAAVMALAPSGWASTADPAPGWDLIYGQFGGETVLAAIAKIAERSRNHYYLSGRRALTFGSTFAASGVRCVAADGALGTGQAAITGLSVDRSSYDLISRIIPVGSGQSKVALTLRATGRSASAGYTLDKSANYLANNAVEAAYRRCERVVSFKDISPLSSTDADVISAANALYDAALYWLNQHSAPVSSYKISVAECPVLVQPLQTVHVTWRDPDQQTTIDADLYVLSVEWAGDTSGVRTAALTVADAPFEPDDDVAAVVDSITKGTVYQALPQLNANAYTIAYTKNVDDVLEANFRFRFDEDTAQLVRVVFDFQLLPLESTVKTVGLEQSTSGTITTNYTGNSGGSGTASSGVPSTNASGTPSTNTTSSAAGSTGAPSTNATSAAAGNTGSAAGSTGGPSTNGTGGPSDNNSGMPSDNTSGGPSNNTSGASTGDTGDSGTLTTNNPQGGDTISAGQHQHTTAITLGATVVYPIGYGASGTAGGLVSSLSGSTHNVPTNQKGAHTHSLNAHTHTLNGHTHSLGGHTHSLNSHTHSLGGHTHDLGLHTHTLAHTHDLGSHTHDLGSHTHAIPHTHDLGNHTHTLGNHTHDISHTHTINHSHVFTPSVYTVYGIFRDVVGNVFALTDLEYQVNGGSWFAFTVGVNGFASLGSSWYRVDLTALLQDSTTLRPLASNNLLVVRKKAAGAAKKATIDAQLGIRNIIQALALN